LIEKGADVNATGDKGGTPLHSASWSYGHTEIVKLLIEKRAHVNATDDKGETPLHWASRHGHTGIVKLLIEKGADVNAKNTKGETSFDIAVKNKVLKILKKHGAKSGLLIATIVLPDLFDAIEDGDIGKVRLFLTKGSNLNIRDKRGRNVLDWAVEKGYTDIVKELLAAGADVNAKGPGGGTALMIAVSNTMTGKDKDLNILKVLLEYGADVYAQTDEGYSAFYMPVMWFGADPIGNKKIIELLKSGGGEPPLRWTGYDSYVLVLSRMIKQKGEQFNDKEMASLQELMKRVKKLEPDLNPGNVMDFLNMFANDKSPAWSPDGSRIAFESDRDAITHQIYVMEADGSNPKRLAYSTMDDSDPIWSPDGTKIVFIRIEQEIGGDEIYIINADGTGEINLSNNPGYDSMPTWSPGGTQIAFASDRDGNREIYVVNIDGTGLTNITKNGGNLPAWSPVSNVIAIVHKFELYIIDADGTSRTKLVEQIIPVRPAWSPDGAQILFFTHTGLSSINVDGTGLRTLTKPMQSTSWPSWSPDGSFIAFAKGRGEIFIMNAKGGKPKMIAKGGIGMSKISWSPDGSKIAFVKGDYDIYVIDVDGTHLRNLSKRRDEPLDQ